MGKAARVSPGLVLFVLLIAFLQTGCFLISLEQLEITSYPSEREQIIGASEELWVSFSVPPVETDAEGLFTVRGGGAAVEGDFEWREGRLYFHPVPDLKPGVRYILSVDGTLSSADGRSFNAQHALPFYAGSAENPSELLLYHPANGEAAALKAPLVFSFSRSMINGTLENEIGIDPHRDVEIEWSDGGKTVSITPDEGWEAHTLYTWSIDESVTDGAGIPLQTSYTGTFIAGTAASVPTLLSMEPAGIFGSSYLVQAGYGREDSLRFIFSEAMNVESLEAAFHIDPDLGGTFHQLDRDTFIFDPNNCLVMNTRYFVTIGTECRSSAGNNIASEIRRSFMPDIPAQGIEQVTFTGASETTVLPADFRSGSFQMMSFSGPGPDYSGSISIRFAETYDEPYRTNIAENLSLHAYFPETVTNPVLITETWNPGSNELTLFYSGFVKSEASPSPEQVLYKLSVPGGAALSMNQNGSFLEEEVWIIFQAEEG